MTKYDLQSLLAIKPNAHINLDRFSDQAYTNNLVRPNVLSEQSVNRPRNVSGHSRRSMMAPLGLSTQNAPRPSNHSSNHSALSSSSQLPPNSQFNDAFVRFVEEHTSPKPQRVTAGGRIVPMNPTVGTVSRSEGKHKSENRSGQRAINPSESKVPKTAPLRADAANAPCFQPLSSSPSAFQYATVPLANQRVQGAGLSTYAALGMSGDSFINAFAQVPSPPQAMGVQPSMFPFQPQPAPTPISNFPNWNSMSSVAPGTFAPYQPGYIPSPLGTGSPWPQYPQFPQVSQVPQVPQVPQMPQLPQVPQARQAVSSQAPTLNQQFAPPYFQETIYQKSLEDAAKQHEALSAQLSQIDRFTAMNAWVINPETKKLLVEQRKSLVRELDTVRLYKEHLLVLFGKGQVSKTPGPPKEAITLPVTPPRNNLWETPTKSKSGSLSPTVRNLYRTIEETDERREPIDGLLRALSGASKGLAKRLSEERKQLLGIPAREPPREVSSTFVETREEPPQEAPEKIEYAQPIHMSRRLWQSDPNPHSPLLSQCFNRDWSPVLQKSAAPAVSQNITAHAFFPSYDGVGKIADDFELL